MCSKYHQLIDAAVREQLNLMHADRQSEAVKRKKAEIEEFGFAWDGTSRRDPAPYRQDYEE